MSNTPSPASSTPEPAPLVIPLPGTDRPEAGAIRAERARILARTLAAEGHYTSPPALHRVPEPADVHADPVHAVTVHNADGGVYRIEYPYDNLDTHAACGEDVGTADLGDLRAHFHTCGACAGASEPPEADTILDTLAAFGVYEAVDFYPSGAEFARADGSTVIVTQDAPDEYAVGVYADHGNDRGDDPTEFYVLPTMAGAALVALTLAGDPR